MVYLTIFVEVYVLKDRSQRPVSGLRPHISRCICRPDCYESLYVPCVKYSGRLVKVVYLVADDIIVDLYVDLTVMIVVFITG